MKKPKTYRLAPWTIDTLQDLKKWHPNMTETEIIEKAILTLWQKEIKEIEEEYKEKERG